MLQKWQLLNKIFLKTNSDPNRVRNNALKRSLRAQLVEEASARSSARLSIMQQRTEQAQFQSFPPITNNRQSQQTINANNHNKFLLL